MSTDGFTAVVRLLPTSKSDNRVESVSGDHINNHNRIHTVTDDNSHQCCDSCKKPAKLLTSLSCHDFICQFCIDTHSPSCSLTVSCPVCAEICIIPPLPTSRFHFDLQTKLMATETVEVAADAKLSVDIRKCAGCSSEEPRWHCHTCQCRLCNDCGSAHRSNPATNSHVVVEMSSSDMSLSPGGNTVEMSSQPTTPVQSCPYHSRLELKFFCTNCDAPLCTECAETFEHSAHSVVLLREAVNQRRTSLRQTLAKVETRLDQLQDSLGHVDILQGQIAAKSSEIQFSIDTIFQRLEKSLQLRRQCLSVELNSQTEAQLKDLLREKGELQTLLMDVRHRREIAEQTVESGNDAEVLLVAKEIGAKLTDFTQMDLRRLIDPDDYPIFQQTNVELADELIRSLGVVSRRSRSVHDAQLHGESLRYCLVGKNSRLGLSTFNHRGELVTLDPSLITAEMLSHQNKPACVVHISSNNDGTFDITFTLDKEGSFFLSVKLCDQHMRGSPFLIRCTNEDQLSGADHLSNRSLKVIFHEPTIPDFCSVHGRASRDSGRLSSIPSKKSVESSARNRSTSRRKSRSPASHTTRSFTGVIEDDLLLKVGIQGRSRGEFINPQGIACTVDGRVVVADSNNQCVQVFSEVGECKLRFGTRGRNPGQIQRPTGVAALPNGNLVVADYDNKWVNIFDPHGKFILRFGAGKLLGPKGVGVTRDGQIVVIDNKASLIYIYTATGKFVRKFGGRGMKANQFAGPHYVAVNAQNHLYITDFHNHSVKVFDGSNGQFLFTFGSMGEGNGQFNAPTGIAIDPYQNVLVADWGNSRIQIFDSSGSFLSFVNSLADPLYGPQDLAITPEGHVVVSDTGNHCYKVYKFLI